MNLGTTSSPPENEPSSVLVRLLSLFSKQFCLHDPAEKLNYSSRRKTVKSLSRQLLSLGFGRGPTHFETNQNLCVERECLSLPAHRLSTDEIKSLVAERHLTKETAVWLCRHHNTNADLRGILSETVAQFDGGPLSLREQSRNAIRHLLGGRHFRTRVALLPLPTSLKEQVTVNGPVTEATENANEDETSDTPCA